MGVGGHRQPYPHRPGKTGVGFGSAMSRLRNMRLITLAGIVVIVGMASVYIRRTMLIENTAVRASGAASTHQKPVSWGNAGNLFKVLFIPC